MGNYTYTLLFQTLVRVGRAHPVTHGFVCELLEGVAERWPTLAYRAAPTETSLIMKGDVIEVLLAQARETGPVIDRTVVAEREELARDICGFGSCWQDILRLITGNNDGAPRLDHLPPPDAICKLMLFRFATLALRPPRGGRCTTNHICATC